MWLLKERGEMSLAVTEWDRLLRKGSFGVFGCAQIHGRDLLPDWVDRSWMQEPANWAAAGRRGLHARALAWTTILVVPKSISAERRFR
jgi:hypothetical protein